MPHAPKPGTGRLGRGAASNEPVTPAEIRAFVTSEFARRLATVLAGVMGGVVLWQALLGSGGLPMARSGMYAPSTTPLSPPTWTHLLWGPALACVVAYAVWAWLPWSRRSARVSATAYPATVSMVLLGAWVWTIDHGRLRTSAVVLLALWASLAVTLWSARGKPSTFVDRQATQLPYALLLGWITVLGASNLGILAREFATSPWPVPTETWWVLGVVGVLTVGMAAVRYLPGRLFIGGTIAWGLLGVAYARVLGQPKAYGVAVTCVVSAVLILVAAVAVLLWKRSRKLY